MITIDPSNNYQIIQSDTYLDTASEENLIVRSKYTNTQENQTFSDIQSEFSFNIPVELKQINSTELAYSADNEAGVQKALQEKGISLIFAEQVDPNINFLYFDSGQLINKYYLDQNFYNTTEKAQEMYQNYQKIFINSPVVSYSYIAGANGITPANIDIYNPQADKASILKTYGISAHKANPIKLKIDKLEVMADYYSDFKLLYFEYKGYIYIISCPEFKEIETSYNSISYDNMKLQDLLKKYYSKNSESPYKTVSDPGN